ncbi:MAG: hypothetical protein IPH57_01540 [Saprospiraceae bacterium]|nr:hypothetical protein [Saprospiraceae bacterium]
MNEIDIRKAADVPLFYKYLERIDKKEIKRKKKTTYINVDFYQTDEFLPFPHYKPISKIIKSGF